MYVTCSLILTENINFTYILRLLNLNIVWEGCYLDANKTDINPLGDMLTYKIGNT